MLVVNGRVVHVYRIGLTALVGVQQNDIGVEHHFVLIHIGNGIRFENQGIVGHLCAVGKITAQAGTEVGTHTLNGYTAAGVIRSIGVSGGPSAEKLARIQCAHTRVIDNLPEHRVRIHVHRFHIQGGNFSGAVLESYLDTVHVVAGCHNIHRE